MNGRDEVGDSKQSCDDKGDQMCLVPVGMNDVDRSAFQESVELQDDRGHGVLSLIDQAYISTDLLELSVECAIVEDDTRVTDLGVVFERFDQIIYQDFCAGPQITGEDVEDVDSIHSAQSVSANDTLVGLLTGVQRE